MSRGRRAALVVTGVVLAGALGLGALASVASTRSDWLLGAAGRALGRELHAQRLGLTVLGGIGVALTGVTIADDPAHGERDPPPAAHPPNARPRVIRQTPRSSSPASRPRRSAR